MDSSVRNMRRLFWLIVFLGGYVWMITTENEQFVLEKGKALYQMVLNWFSNADIDFQIRKKEISKTKSRPRRWD
jgi:hypothetical protein